MSERVIVHVKGKQYPGEARGYRGDGRVYVILDDGVAANFPEGDVRPFVERKPWPPVDLETK